MLRIRSAGPDDVDVLVAFEAALFAEDAARYEPLADPTWPAREGRGDFERLLESDRCIVLVADSGTVNGHLVGYLAESSPTRRPATYAIIRSLYIDPHHRRRGIGSLLVEHFIAWARQHRCAEIHVDAYANNTDAQLFYERHGFPARSISRTREL